jgi:predicted aconitase with swiveling domain
MNTFSPRRLPCLLLYGLMSVSPVASALQATGNASLGVEFTDNATKVGANEVDDQILSAQVGGTLAKTEGAATGNASYSLSHQQYLDNTFGDRNYLNLGSGLNWEPVKNRVNLTVQDYFTQTSVDNLAVNVPTNRQNTNVFSISSGISFPLADRHKLTISPSFRDYTYNKSDTDNQQLSLSAGWFYQYKPTMQLSLNGSTSKVEHDSSTNSDYDSDSVNLAVSGTTARMRYSASVGKTWVDRVALIDNNGVSASLSLVFDVSGRSTLQAHLSQDITNSSALFLGYAIDPATGNITNVQISGEAVRNRSMRVSYERTGSTVNTSVWTELRKLDYSSATPDRDVQEVGASAVYSVTPLINASLSGSYVRNDQAASSVEQEEVTIGAGLGYKLSRRMGVNFNLSHRSRDTTNGTSDYDEFSLAAGLAYNFWP